MAEIFVIVYNTGGEVVLLVIPYTEQLLLVFRLATSPNQSNAIKLSIELPVASHVVESTIIFKQACK